MTKSPKRARPPKRPNTNSSREDRERKRNQRYLWVSKPLIEVPVEGSNLKTVVALPVGKQYRKPIQADNRKQRK